jgi:hypothetical protein
VVPRYEIVNAAAVPATVSGIDAGKTPPINAV